MSNSREKHKKTKDSKTLNKNIQIDINFEEYDIYYREETDPIMLNVYLIKIIEDKNILRIEKTNEFYIKNLTRIQRYKEEAEIEYNKSEGIYKEEHRCLI